MFVFCVEEIGEVSREMIARNRFTTRYYLDVLLKKTSKTTHVSRVSMSRYKRSLLIPTHGFFFFFLLKSRLHSLRYLSTSSKLWLVVSCVRGRL